jgi:RNA polymerase sigma factor (sigma-70 family)
MGSGLIEPDDIQAIFAKSGKDWDVGETQRVIDWLREPGQLGYYLRYGMCALRQVGTSHDVEETLQELFQRFYKVVSEYDPKRSPFGAYYYFLWRQSCGKKKKTLGRRLTHERTGALRRRDVDSDEELELEVVDDHPDSDPVESARRRERHEAFEDCLNQLEPRERSILVEHHLEGRSFKEIAKTHKISVPNAKVIAHRARQKLGLCVKAKIREDDL